MEKSFIEENLRKRLFLLSGCDDFGNCDGMTGCCVDCSYDNPELFERCNAFSAIVDYYNTRQLEKSLNIKNCKIGCEHKNE